MDLERPARLDALEDANQPFADTVSRCDLDGFLFLADIAAGQVDDRPLLLAGRLQRRFDQLAGLSLHVVFEVLVQNTAGREVACHSLSRGDLPQMPTKDQPIKAVQDAPDQSRKNA